MSGIKDQIQQKSQEYIQKILRRAEKIKQRELELARKKKSQILEESRNKVDLEVEQKKSSLEAQLILEFKLKEEKFKEDLCSQVILEAQNRLQNFSSQQRLDSLKILIAKSLMNLGLKEAKVVVNSQDLQILNAHFQELKDFLKEHIEDFKDVILQEGSIQGGVKVFSLHSSEFLDNSWDSRIRKFQAEFRKRIIEEISKEER